MTPGRGKRGHVGVGGVGGPGRGGDRADTPARIVIDGRNVQRAMERGSAPGSVPTTALIARIRAAFPAGTDVELVLDGHPGGGVQGRLVRGFTVTFGRGVSADEVIADRAATVLRELGPVGAWAVAVVSDDREVRDAARRSGVRVEGTAWLLGRIARQSAAGSQPTPDGRPAASRGASIGHGRPPRGIVPNGGARGGRGASTSRRTRTRDAD